MESPLDEDEGPVNASSLGSARREPGGCASCAFGGSGDHAVAALAIAGLALMIATRRRRR
jgi:MYXO-CTERM domain-containing protein